MASINSSLTTELSRSIHKCDITGIHIVSNQFTRFLAELVKFHNENNNIKFLFILFKDFPQLSYTIRGYGTIPQNINILTIKNSVDLDELESNLILFSNMTGSPESRIVIIYGIELIEILAERDNFQDGRQFVLEYLYNIRKILKINRLKSLVMLTMRLNSDNENEKKIGTLFRCKKAFKYLLDKFIEF